MEERDNRNIMCSVLFLDIVEYSKKTVAGQISLKDRFNSYLSAAICDIPVEDRIILDTGDGAAINFLGDVEDALKTAISLRESMLNEDPNLDLPLLVRMGINLGPVRLVRDINGQPNIVGDGINVAQRVMAFADASQILVSRAYFDAASRISPTYAGMFHYQGSRTDKHVREHEIYAIGYPGDKTSLLPAAHDATEPQHGKTGWRFPVAVAGALAILIGLIGMLMLAPAGKMPIFHRAVQVQPGVQPASAVAPIAPVAAPHAENQVTENAVKPDLKAETKPDRKKSVESKTDRQAKRVDQPRPADTVRPSVGSVTAKDAYISIICHEGARIYMDGTEKGKLSSTELTIVVAPGKHQVIVTGKKSGISEQNIELKPGKKVIINPDFCRK